MNTIDNQTIDQVDQQNQNSVFFHNLQQTNQAVAEQAITHFLKTNVMDILQPLQFQIMQLRLPPSQINSFAYNWLKNQCSLVCYLDQRQKNGQFLDEENRVPQEVVQPDQVFYYRVKQKLKKRAMQKFRYGVCGESCGKKFMRFSQQGKLCFDDGNLNDGTGVISISINPSLNQSKNFQDFAANQCEKSFSQRVSKCNSNQKIRKNLKGSLRTLKRSTDVALSSKNSEQSPLKRKIIEFNINMEPRVSEDIKTKNTQLSLLVQLRKCILFKQLDEQTIHKMINCMDKRTIYPLDIIYQSGDTLNQFMIIGCNSKFQLIKKRDEDQSLKIKRHSVVIEDKEHSIELKSNNSSQKSDQKVDQAYAVVKQQKKRLSTKHQVHRKMSTLSKFSQNKSSSLLNLIYKSQAFFLNQNKKEKQKSQQKAQTNRLLNQKQKREDQVSSQVSQWNFFGQMSLLYPIKAEGTLVYKGSQQAIIWTLSRSDYSFVLKHKAQQKLRLCCHVFHKAQILSTLTAQEKVKLAQISIQKSYHKGSFVVRQGQIGNCFYLVVSGNLVAQKGEKRSRQVKPVYYYSHGDYFGEIALVRNVPRQASVKALTYCKLIVIQRNGFRRIFGSLQKLLRRNENHYMHIRKQLRRISLQSRVNAIQKNIKQKHQQ